MTKLPTRRTVGVVGAILLAAAGIAWAAAVEEAYRAIPGTPAVYRSSLSGADSFVTATAANGRATDGDPAVHVSPRFSAASATCCVEVLLCDASGNVVTTAGVQTATASGLRRVGESGPYLPAAGSLVFDTLGYPVVDIRMHAVSSGTVDLWAGKTGAKSLQFGSSQ